ncbi:hypothetical protein S7711_08650 [Stachybotrys chartarum IBT 7711]|jgi:hypothetical protein|uniref:Uncharacterized protein n=1 Tax=Stachybotrys chartarum (strain CBS 109288 / IBT 7711) TaxID=1280523 RepID=A0A084AXU0_STACB|nr:hypothetical protein S7711_08650 [Stachybotrys chartarum IBT 7711]KFA50621.1 hypothetical protein S40293_08382 [Stachybotrys chartarum IBT 40293]KFA73189.1 hypothetical protein S40288_08920 [Stachybotrys chartarum IBT 40288]
MSGATLSTQTTQTSIAVPDKAALSPLEKTITDMSTPVSTNSDNPFMTDIEALDNAETRQTCRSKLACSNVHDKSDLMVWPDKKYWARRDKAAKIKRSCTFMAHMSPRNRIITKIAIILFIVGVALGVGFGISRAMDAPIWGDRH